MRKVIVTLLFAMALMPAFGQSCYWVLLTDKQGTTFDPYTYFDAKAIERYQQNGADLYDISNYPLNESYVGKVDAIATEEVGCSRWMNAVAVMATPDQIARIEQLPFVSRIQRIGGDMQLASMSDQSDPSAPSDPSDPSAPSPQPKLTDQLIRMQGNLFRDKGIDGKGLRIAVFDGGFPRVNTHEAFKHLRDNHRILDTWNFPNKKADVYGWNSHGLATLSCITGIVGQQQLGMATGAEFLLYRTEVELEPFKEEVWWMQAVERADKHGANIISSSLGYGKERYWTKDMDGTSYVAKAGNLAARKGILVCCSAGNEADTKEWKTIVTPSDADSVLCVGGIEMSLDRYRHISFSSFGPSADGRLKPNVSAFGHVYAAANSGDDAVSTVYGTSFSCPLTAGFAACAWQTMPGKTAMEMFDLIQKSADLYPYYDYALGYGVPQASYFVNGSRKNDPTFVLRETKDSVEVHLLKPTAFATVFYNKQRPDGTLVRYASCELENVALEDCLRFYKGSLDSCRLNVCYDGYTATYSLSEKDWQRMRLERANFACTAYCAHDDFDRTTKYDLDASDLVPSNWGSNAKNHGEIYVQYGSHTWWGYVDAPLFSWSPSFHFGYRLMHAFGKAYKLGAGIEWNVSNINYATDKANEVDDVLGIAPATYDVKRIKRHQFDLELFQRVRFAAGGLVSNGVYWDLGVFAGWNPAHRYLLRQTVGTPNGTNKVNTEYSLTTPVEDYRFVWGVSTRVVYDIIGIYARCTMPFVYSKCGCVIPIPMMELGVQLSL
ncbi:MAG: S8 family serine peptidase [Bacteroidales bacterium]|nr:S8 family serine peptidase [Bacteroidales bacterium]